MVSIQGTTKLLGLIGDPVEHSLSPAMHNAAIAQMNLEYAYVPFPVKSKELPIAVAGLAAIGVRGFNVTIPHKQAILPLLAEVDSLARAVGAVNTVWWGDRGWQGTNTDVAGFLAPLQGYNWDWCRVTVGLMGCGGAARAAIAGCIQLGCKDIHVFGRSWEKLQHFQKSWERQAFHPPVGGEQSFAVPIAVHRWEDLPDWLPRTHLLINATPIGMAPNPHQSPLDAAMVALLPTSALVYDLIYTPSPTQLLRMARCCQITGIDGVEMLVQQGAAALKLWVDRAVPVEVMRQELLVALASRGT